MIRLIMKRKTIINQPLNKFMDMSVRLENKVTKILLSIC